jgi:hypothetical protein
MSSIPGRPGIPLARKRMLACMDEAGWKREPGAVDGDIAEICLGTRDGDGAARVVALEQP